MVRHGLGSDRSADFHAQHSPVGALASFALGRHHRGGGPGCELGGPAGCAVWAGYREEGRFHLLPFFPVGDDELKRYVQGQGAGERRRLFAPAEIARDLGWATDAWCAGDVALSVFTPVEALPDPAVAPPEAQRDAFVPAVCLRLTVANPGAQPRLAVFGLTGPERWLPVQGATGWRTRSAMGFATRAAGATAHVHFNPEEALLPGARAGNLHLGNCALVAVPVPPGATVDVDLVVGWYHPGIVTIGREMRYWYTRLFAGIDDVLGHALRIHAAVRARAAARDAELAASGLPDERRFLIAHATRSYHGSTQLLDDGGRPRWIVNEGEYLMHNTLDLTVDMAPWELRFSPWALANVLEQFASEYRYEDDVWDPAEPGRRRPGGVTFTHEMGAHGVFPPAGRSSYEMDGLDRICFASMGTEELLNWICCAGLYWGATRDAAFLARHAPLLRACLQSWLNRDHPDPARRRGLPQCDGWRSHPGGEITTYDSLDHALGQARGNLYLAVKGWGACLVLEELLRQAGDPDAAAEAAASARRSADTVVGAWNPTLGRLPAILGQSDDRAIIPAVEGVFFPHRLGLHAALAADGPYAALLDILRRHLRAVLVPGVCLYPDGGWKISSGADNSWMSKIVLCQFVAERILGVPQEPAAAARADRAHADWERLGAADTACGDQFTAGKVVGSKWYPRIVTSLLWLEG